MDQLKPSAANSSPLTPVGFLERSATVYGNSISLIYNTTSYTWSTTYRRCLRLASSISALLGIHKNVVSVLAPNIPAMYELHFAIPMAGAVLHTINTRLDARTVSVLLRHSESKLLFVDYQSTSVALEAISLFPPNTPRPVLILITDDEQVTEGGVDFYHVQVTGGGVDFLTSYEEMVETGDVEFKWVRPDSEWDPLTLNYTSGTTSSPKGVVNSHRGTFIVAVDALLEWSVPKQPVYLWTLPMYHANGWSFTWGMAAVGGTNVCLRKFDVAAVYAAIQKHNVTHICGAPVVLNLLSDTPKVLRNPVHVLTSGAPPPVEVLLRTEALGFVVSHIFGMTETGGPSVVCSWKREWDGLPPTERARLKARQGVRTLGMAELDVVEPVSGLSVTRDGSTLGELVLRGGGIMLGYLKDPEETSRCMRENGWFYTGDLAVMHPDGYIEIKDRAKDVIISGGENLSSVEVESALYSHPGIKEAAVVARPDEFWGETPCAFVCLKAETGSGLSEKEIIEHCRGKLPRFMVPRTVVFKEELPKTSTGKIQKNVLREMAQAMGSISRIGIPL